MPTQVQRCLVDSATFPNNHVASTCHSSFQRTSPSKPGTLHFTDLKRCRKKSSRRYGLWSDKAGCRCSWYQLGSRAQQLPQNTVYWALCSCEEIRGEPEGGWGCTACVWGRGHGALGDSPPKAPSWNSVRMRWPPRVSFSFSACECLTRDQLSKVTPGMAQPSGCTSHGQVHYSTGSSSFSKVAVATGHLKFKTFRAG